MVRIRIAVLSGLLAALICTWVGPSLHAQTVSEQFLFAALNEERAALGLPALNWNPQLALAARSHATWMQRKGAISHGFQGEPELQQRAALAGAHFSTVAENVAVADTAPRIHEAWMHSPGHRANILDARLTSVGIAIVTVAGRQWAVQDFEREVMTMSLGLQETRVADLLRSTSGLQATSSEDARKTCEMKTGYAGQRPWFVMRYTATDLEDLPDQLTARLRTGKYRQAIVGACPARPGVFSSYSIAVLLYP